MAFILCSPWSACSSGHSCSAFGACSRFPSASPSICSSGVKSTPPQPRNLRPVLLPAPLKTTRHSLKHPYCTSPRALALRRTGVFICLLAMFHAGGASGKHALFIMSTFPRALSPSVTLLFSPVPFGAAHRHFFLLRHILQPPLRRAVVTACRLVLHAKISGAFTRIAPQYGASAKCFAKALHFSATPLKIPLPPVAYATGGRGCPLSF